MKKTAAVIAISALTGAAMADIDVNLSGLTSNDGLGGANVVLMVDTGVPNVEITGIAWDLEFVPISPSWTSEPHWDFANGAFDWDMGDFGGVDDSNPIVLAGGTGTSFFADGAGMVRIELWEDFNDFANAPDGTYTQGTLTLEFIPAPSSLALLGLGGLVATRRRR